VVDVTPSQVVSYITAAVTVASVIAAVLPQGAPGSMWSKLRAIIDAVAMNWGNAANKPKA